METEREGDSKAPRPQPVTLRLALLGKPSWQCQGKRGFLDPRDAAWLARLAIDTATDQRALARILWPVKEITSAIDSLKQRFSALRKVIGHSVCAGGERVHFVPGVNVDLHARIDEISLAELLNRGELLAGLTYPNYPVFQEWLDRERLERRRSLVSALNGHCLRLENEGQREEALKPLERVVMLDPTCEVAWLRLLRLHFLQGNRMAVVECFARLERQMTTQGLPMHPEAHELLQMVQRGSAPAFRVATLPPALERPPMLVGRDQQWQAMEQAWSRGNPFLLRGEAGIGKTRLMQEFVQGRPGTLIVEARPGDDQSACLVLKRVLRATLQAYAFTLDNEFVRHQLSRLLDEFGPPPLGTTIQEEAIWEAAEHLLLAAISKGLQTLLVDNLHFADLPSVRALRWLSASKDLDAISFGFTTRDEQSAELRVLVDTWLTDPKPPIEIGLIPLSVDHLAQLIEGLNLPERLPTSLASLLHARIGGNPYVTIEMLIELWRKNADPAQPKLSIPASIASQYRALLRAVPTAYSELLWIAALMGGDFTVDRANAVARLGAVALSDGLLALERCRVFAGPRFRHDLWREFCLTEVPEAAWSLLHAKIAEALTDEPGIPPGRLAHYWEAAGGWAPAARCLLAAAQAARMAGQLEANQVLLERAGTCWQRAKDFNSAFDAFYRRVVGMQVLNGSKAVMGELAQLQALALTPQHHARVALLRADALVHLDENDEALDVADDILRHATLDPNAKVEALIVRTTALAQLGRRDEALSAQEEATALAERLATAEQVLRLTHLRVILLFHQGRIGQAVAAARKSAELARSAGELIEATQVDGNLCTLLMVCGETGEAYELARCVRRQHDTMGSSTNSPTRGLNLVALCNSAAWLGYYGEALEAITAAAVVLQEDAPAHAQAIVRMSSAYLWLTLGDSRKAAEALPTSPEGLPPAVQMRWHWAQARIAVLEGRPANLALNEIGKVQAAHPKLPNGQSAWLEWSWQGDPRTVIERLRLLRQQALRDGMHGFARATMVRELDRLNELDEPDALQAAIDLASELGDVGIGSMSFQIYLPDAWLILARLWDRVGDETRAYEARAAGRAWVLKVAERLKEPTRQNFFRGNPVNDELLRDENRPD